MTPFLRELRSGRVLLMDGAMGTELARITEAEYTGSAYPDLTEPERVALIHGSYTSASARVILTNTFQINPHVLAERQSAKLHHTLWHSAIASAKIAIPRADFILGDIGPLTECTPEIAATLVKECRSLDGVMLETWSSTDDLACFAKARGKLPLLVSFTYRKIPRKGWRTFTDVAPEDCAHAAKKHGAVAIGVNCGLDLGLKQMREIVKRYHDACELPVFVRPNAGTPTETTKGWAYPRTPEQMADELPPLLDEGIAMVGGCCGTTPEHIRQMAAAIEKWEG